MPESTFLGRSFQTTGAPYTKFRLKCLVDLHIQTKCGTSKAPVGEGSCTSQYVYWVKSMIGTIGQCQLFDIVLLSGLVG